MQTLGGEIKLLDEIIRANQNTKKEIKEVNIDLQTLPNSSVNKSST